MEAAQSTGIFINGRAQIVEMLRIMPSEEKNKLLKNMAMRNPSLAHDLVEESLGFEDIKKLSDTELGFIFGYVSAPVLGIALKNVSLDFQRRILGLAPRNYAEEAYKILVTSIPNEKRDIARAQKKIVLELVRLIRKKDVQM